MSFAYTVEFKSQIDPEVEYVIHATIDDILETSDACQIGDEGGCLQDVYDAISSALSAIDANLSVDDVTVSLFSDDEDELYFEEDVDEGWLEYEYDESPFIDDDDGLEYLFEDDDELAEPVLW